MTDAVPFDPIHPTSNLAVTDVSDNVEMPRPEKAGTERSIRVVNTGDELAFVRFGDETVSADETTGMPIPAGVVEVFQMDTNHTHAAGITASGTTTLYFTRGRGL